MQRNFDGTLGKVIEKFNVLIGPILLYTYATSIVTIVPGETLLITEMKKLWFSGRKLITISLEKHEIRICMGKVWHQFLSNSLWVCIIIECKSNINRNARNIKKHFE